VAETSVRAEPSFAWSLLVAVLTAAVLAIAVKAQIFDTNFQSLWEATALLAGDHPYRDFFEWGMPGQMVVSAAVQWLVGYRLIGEFVLQWAFIVVAMVISFRMACRVSGSVKAAFFASLVALIAIAVVPIYHYPKLFFYPAMLALGWRYLDRPGAGIGALLGFTTAVAFLFRHDHGIYLGVGSVLTFVLARKTTPLSGAPRASLKHAGAYAAAAAVVVVPWLIVVHGSEGLPQYVHSRLLLAQGDETVPPWVLYGVVLSANPLRLVRGAADSLLWLEQVSLVVPLLLLGSAAIDIAADRRQARRLSPDTAAILLAGALLMGVGLRLFREPSYAAILAPATAAFGARFLTRPRWPVRAAAVAVFVLCALAGLFVVRSSSLGNIAETIEDLPRMFGKLRSRPPMDAFTTRADAERFNRHAPEWAAEPVPLGFLMRYVRDCTRQGDRVLVTGSTPFQVGYLVERPIAGGHVFWHRGWRADSAREAESLALLRRQSVPFAISTHDPVLADLKPYPRIFAHFRSRYVEVPETGGRLLVERERRAVGEFGPLRYPCFQNAGATIRH
jgi:hypothetical protein